MTKKTITLAGIAMLAIAHVAVPAFGHEGHHHDSYSAGEPGDASQLSRTIEINMTEMAFAPSRIEVRRGEQIRFVIHNDGTEDHEFLLATTKENLAHAEVMKKHPHMEHDDPNGVRLSPYQSAELVWKFSKAGTFEYACLIPKHRDYGMLGHVVVK
ncbi:cupredoxin family protein [Bradyrhizobium sp.]|jgi:uncharacterized cupredoxin-like copper-binding protein|uniref:cupredoxin domain-containing protein n=1 Tax=Bradyrhizobium sp. TaxID=376 RepID=UPI002BA59DF5|nr:cupredoxin family protein [Bradyrhizobium sp.]HWX62691.1 cupredoxin family protein [Bradyrhizobium sp.]